MRFAGASLVDEAKSVLFDAGVGPYPYGSPMLAVGYAGKPVAFTEADAPIGPPVGVRAGKATPFVGVVRVVVA